MTQTALRAMNQVMALLRQAIGGCAATDAEYLSKSVDAVELEWRLRQLNGRTQEQALYRLAACGV